MIKKIIKIGKTIILIIIIAGITYFATMKGIASHGDHVEHATQIAAQVANVKVIDKEMIIKALHSKAELVSNSGEVEKNYTYTDSIFKGHNYIKDMIGQRTLDVVAKGYFKTGFDLSSISSDNIQVYGQTLFIKLPKDQMKLISLDVPFNALELNEQSGLVRSNLNLQDKQAIYGEIRKMMVDEIMGSNEIREKTYNSAVEALQNLMEKIPNCTKVVIQERLH